MTMTDIAALLSLPNDQFIEQLCSIPELKFYLNPMVQKRLIAMGFDIDPQTGLILLHHSHQSNGLGLPIVRSRFSEALE